MPWIKRSDRKVSDKTYYESTRRNSPILLAAARFRSTQRWRKLSSTFLIMNPLCIDPFSIHDTNFSPAIQVHHIVPLVERMDLALEWNNLASICIGCHRKVEQLVREGKKKELEGLIWVREDQQNHQQAI